MEEEKRISEEELKKNHSVSIVVNYNIRSTTIFKLKHLIPNLRRV